MSRSVEFEFIGVKALQDQLLEIADIGTAKKVLRDALRFAIKPLVKTAKQLAPKDTGDLANSIGLVVVIPKTGNIVMSAGIKMKTRRIVSEVVDIIEFSDGSTADWKVKANRAAGWRWHFAEFGTSKQAAHPFLRPAFDQHSQGMIESFRTWIAASIVNIAAKRRNKGIT